MAKCVWQEATAIQRLFTPFHRVFPVYFVDHQSIGGTTSPYGSPYYANGWVIDHQNATIFSLHRCKAIGIPELRQIDCRLKAPEYGILLPPCPW
jgi:hypothetical protein